MDAIKTDVAGSWDEHKTKLKERFTNITDEDLKYEAGRSDEMFGRLMQKLEISREEMAAVIACLHPK